MEARTDAIVSKLAVTWPDLRSRITCGLFGDHLRSGIRPNRSVIIRVMNKIGQVGSGSPICLITSMITDRIGWHEVLLTIVSLRNRTARRRRRQNACVWQTSHCYYLRVLSWSSLNINVFWSWQKDQFNGKWILAKCYFKRNYCHACHTRVAVFNPLPSCCVSSLINHKSSLQQIISTITISEKTNCFLFLWKSIQC